MNKMETERERERTWAWRQRESARRRWPRKWAWSRPCAAWFLIQPRASKAETVLYQSKVQFTTLNL
jgi:hypothetical protein